MKIKALIFDRDGTLIEHIPYLCDPAQVRLLPEVSKALRYARDSGCLLFLHTNQSGVGRGMFDLACVHECNDRMIELLGLGPELFERICIAPEAPDMPALYRKPSPLFAREVMRDYRLQPGEVCYLGDRGSDLAAAQASGTLGIGISTGLDDLAAELLQLDLAGKFPVFDGLFPAIRHLIKSS